jgi:hypothetical protein
MLSNVAAATAACMCSVIYLEARAVCVCADHVEGATWLVLLPNGECHQRGHVAGEEVLATCIRMLQKRV